jgi:biotin carboxylase
MAKKVAVIIDAFSTGHQLGSYFKKHNFDLIHIESTKGIPASFKKYYRSEDFQVDILHEGDIKQTAEKLRAYHPQFVIAGAESGVELADYLSLELGLDTCNLKQLIEARRDKYLMIETIAQAGLPTAKQLKTNELDELLSWVKETNDWPIVIKPVKSASSDHVTFCYTVDEVAQAFQSIFGTTNMFGLENQEVLAQTFVTGQQYIVNAISFEGEHFITDIWEENFIESSDNNVMYDTFNLVENHGTIQSELIEYVKKVLTNLGIQHGPSHTELRYTKNGPVIIETAARMMGESFDEQVYYETLNYNLPSITAECYIDGKSLKQRFAKGYQKKQHLVAVFMISHHAGMIESTSGLEHIRSLPTFAQIRTNAKVGSILEKTTAAMSHTGVILLAGKDREQIDKDTLTIRNLEKDGKLFTLTESSILI